MRHLQAKGEREGNTLEGHTHLGQCGLDDCRVSVDESFCRRVNHAVPISWIRQVDLVTHVHGFVWKRHKKRYIGDVRRMLNSAQF